MTQIGSQLRAYFEETTEPLTVEEVLARRTVVVGDGTNRRPAQDRSSGPASWWSGPRLAVTAALIAVVTFVGVTSLLTGPRLDVGGGESAAAAAEAIEELHRALAERDATAVEEFFGEDVVLNSYLNLDFVGPEAAAYLMRISVPMTIEDIDAPVANEDGSFTIVVLALAETHRYPENWTYRVFMDGAEVVAVDLESVDPA